MGGGRVKGFLRGGRNSTEKADQLSQKPIQDADEAMSAEVSVEFSDDELQEFLEGDILDVRADPAFKERLRRKLWEIVRGRMGDDPGSDGI
jgi:hypothetical protein